MEIKDLLPIGTVVLLNDGSKKVMICGVKQMDNETKKEYDYIGVLYPEGFIGNEFKFIFNHEDIKEIFYRGYENEERTDFLEKLSAFYEEND